MEYYLGKVVREEVISKCIDFGNGKSFFYIRKSYKYDL